jgi:hypothetical protein
MTFETDLLAQLNTIAPLTAIVANRMYPVVLPKNAPPTTPYLLYQTISYVPAYALSGATTIAQTRIGLNMRADTYLDSINAREAIRLALSGWYGAFPGGTDVRGIRVVNKFDDFDADALLYRSGIQLIIQYNEITN